MSVNVDTTKLIDTPFGVWTRRCPIKHVLGLARILPQKGPLYGVILGHAHTCQRSITSTLFAFELAISVMFNSLNMLSKLLQTKTTASTAFWTGN